MSSNEPAGTAVAQRNPAQELVARLRTDEARKQIADALPTGVSVDRFTRATATALLQNPDLAKTDEAALFQAIVKCAQDGLFPDGREAALVVYKGKAQYLPMIGGVRKIAAEYGWTIRTHVVYANDEFEVQVGTDDRIMHRPARIGTERGDLVAAYAIAHHRDGRRSFFEVMTAEDVMKAKAVAQTDRVWKQWPAQMWEKTVGHRIAKKLPLDPVDAQRLNRVIDAASLDPVENAVLLYGPAARETFGELPAGALETSVQSTDTSEGAFDDTAEASHPPEEPQAASLDDTATDEFGDEPEVVATNEEGPSDMDVEAAQTASSFQVNITAKSWVNGLTISEINGRGDEGQAFFRWALGPKNKNADLRASVEAYAKVQLPFLYGELVSEAS